MGREKNLRESSYEYGGSGNIVVVISKKSGICCGLFRYKPRCSVVLLHVNGVELVDKTLPNDRLTLRQNFMCTMSFKSKITFELASFFRPWRFRMPLLPQLGHSVDILFVKPRFMTSYDTIDKFWIGAHLATSSNSTWCSFEKNSTIKKYILPRRLSCLKHKKNAWYGSTNLLTSSATSVTVRSRSSKFVLFTLLSVLDVAGHHFQLLRVHLGKAYTYQY